MFDGETGNSHNGAGLRAKDAGWRSYRVYDAGGAILVSGKDAQASSRRRISGYVEETSTEDAAWSRKRPPDAEDL